MHTQLHRIFNSLLVLLARTKCPFVAMLCRIAGSCFYQGRVAAMASKERKVKETTQARVRARDEATLVMAFDILAVHACPFD